MAYRHSLHACLLCLFIVACSGESDPGTTASDAEPASETEEEGEAGPATGQPHWTNDEPIGLGMAPVNAAMQCRTAKRRISVAGPTATSG